MTEQQARAVNKYRENFDVYIGRGSIWGNPFVINKHGNRAEVIAQHRAWLATQPQLIAQIDTLAGKRLGCFCAPQPCHGDTLAALTQMPAERRVDWLNGR